MNEEEEEKEEEEEEEEEEDEEGHYNFIYTLQKLGRNGSNQIEGD